MSQNTSKDARVARTQAALKTALLDLLAESTLDEISVDSLCAAAGVHRATLYRHYACVRDVLEEIGEETIRSIGTRIERTAGRPASEVLACALVTIKDNAKTLRALHNLDGGTRFVQTICSYAFDIARGVPARRAVNSPALEPTPQEAYLCGGFVALAEHWALSGMRRPVSEVVHDAVSLLPDGSP